MYRHVSHESHMQLSASLYNAILAASRVGNTATTVAFVANMAFPIASTTRSTVADVLLLVQERRILLSLYNLSVSENTICSLSKVDGQF